jgi:hypothetical protein
MTLRDYFAARAPMPPPRDFLRDSGYVNTGKFDEIGQEILESVRPAETNAQYFARWSIHYADTMLAERLK